jgi:receptor-type tyrosine-protein phosphatase gamma
VVTDVAGPSAPIITNLTCKDEQSIFLQWDRPKQLYKTIDYYYIYYRSEEQWQFKEIGVGMNGTLSKGSKVASE